MTHELITVDAPPTTNRDRERLDLLKRTLCKDLTDDEFALFVEVARTRGLDPFTRQIHAVKRRNKDTYVMTIQTGIDGFRLIADRTGRYAPGQAPAYEYNDRGNLHSATAYIRKMTPDGTWHEVAAAALWSEYAQYGYGDKLSPMWAKMPHTMLAKCAEALALRKAFPADLSGLYTDDEMAQAENGTVEVVPQTQLETASNNAALLSSLKVLWATASQLYALSYAVPANWRGVQPATIPTVQISEAITKVRTDLISRIDLAVAVVENAATVSGVTDEDADWARQWQQLAKEGISDNDLRGWAGWAHEAANRYEQVP